MSEPAELQAQLDALSKEMEKMKAELQGEQQKVKRYRAAMKPSSQEDQGALFDNIAYAMKDAGFGDAEVAQYLAMAKQAREEQAKPPAKQPDGEKTVEDLLKELGLEDEAGGGGVEAELRRELDEIKKQISQQRDEDKKSRWEKARRRIERQVDHLTKTDPRIQKLIESRVELEDDTEAQTKVKEILTKSIREDLWKSTVEELKTRADASGGKWDEDWIDEVAERSATSVGDKFRSVIGDPARLRRTPETVTGLEGFDPDKKKPVAPPQFKQGLARGELDTQAKDYAVDSLMRGLVEASKGGETKV